MKKTVLITGASGNLGGALIHVFLEHDFKIAALVTPLGSSEIPESEDLRVFPVDLTDESRVKEVIQNVYDRFGSIEMAVLTVGGFAMGNLIETEGEDFNKMYRLNFLTTYLIARQLFIRMNKQEGGQLVFIGTRPAMDPGLAKDMLAYSLSKSLLFRLAEVINQDGKERGIKAGIVIPGTMDTPQNRMAMPDADFSKWVSPVEVAEKIYHLSTPAGQPLRDSIIEVYGKP
jgi:NAD(P)-dependent dehydrogenase (short-subunit alcohol dehydrogenase family)